MKKLIVFLLALITLLCLALSVSAEGTPEDFVHGVNGIDPEGSYGDRKDCYDALIAAYAALSPERQTSVSESYALLLAEGEALSELAKRAESFLAKLSELDECVGLSEKETVVIDAQDESLYFDDISYPGIADALAVIADVQGRVEKSVAFIDAVGAAKDKDIEDYADVTGYLALAKSYMSGADATYPGVPVAISDYGYISSAIMEREGHTRAVLDAIDELEHYQSYKDKKHCVSQIEAAMADELFESECRGVAEGLAKLEQTYSYFRECIRRANVFITAVSVIDDVDAADRPAAMLQALHLLADTDVTADGASAALDALENNLERYNEAVMQINGANSLL